MRWPKGDRNPLRTPLMPVQDWSRCCTRRERAAVLNDWSFCWSVK
jgi:hypothetical protein